MWEDEILEELHRIREEHAKSFNYDFKAIFADWQRRQAANGKNVSFLATQTAQYLKGAFVSLQRLRRKVRT